MLCFIGLKFTDYCYPIVEIDYDLNKINLHQIFRDLYQKNKFDCIYIKNQKVNFFKKKNIFFKYFDLSDMYKEDLSCQIHIKTDWENFVGKKREKKIKSLNNAISKKVGNGLKARINVTDLSLHEKKRDCRFFNKKKDRSIE